MLDHHGEINVRKKYDKNFKITDVWDNRPVSGYCYGKGVWHHDTLFSKFIMSSNGKNTLNVICSYFHINTCEICHPD